MSVMTVEFTFSQTPTESKSCCLSTLQQSHHVPGEQKQPGDGDVSDVGPRPSGEEQPEVAGGRRRELWGAASPAGNLREERNPEAAAVGSSALRTVRHPHRGLRPCETRGRVRLFLLSSVGVFTRCVINLSFISYKKALWRLCLDEFNVSRLNQKPKKELWPKTKETSILKGQFTLKSAYLWCCLSIYLLATEIAAY